MILNEVLLLKLAVGRRNMCNKKTGDGECRCVHVPTTVFRSAIDFFQAAILAGESRGIGDGVA